MNEDYWAAYRKRVRRRANSQGSLILCPWVVIISILKIVEPMDYPVGDIRNNITFRLIFYGLFIALAILGMLVSVRWLLADRRRTN